MKTVLFFTFLSSIAKAGLWVSIGILVKNHFDLFISSIVRRPMPDHVMEEQNQASLNNIKKWIGLCIIAIGMGLALVALSTLVVGCTMPGINFEF